MFCSNCGEKLIENARFCHKCGLDLEITVKDEPMIAEEEAVIEKEPSKKRGGFVESILH